MMDKILLEQKNKLIDEIRNYFESNSISKAIIGMSGGIDSAVGLNILNEAIGKDKILAYFIDIESSKDDYLDATSIASKIDIKINYVNLVKTYEAFKNDINQNNKHALGNIKSRLRTIFLYDEAFNNNGIVCGNSNLDELYVGYYTKYGDNACDLFLLSNFTKSDIYELAHHYKIPEKIINKPPSAGLFAGQTDEQDLGINYEVIDKFLLGNKISNEHFNVIEKLHNRNKHKLFYNYVDTNLKNYNLPWLKKKKKINQ